VVSYYRSKTICRAAGIFLAALAMIALVPASAAAQNLFDTLFGRVSQPAARELPPPPSSLGAPLALFDRATPNRSYDDAGGPSASYCVRLCDGRYFPLQRNSAISPAEQCRSFCPAAKTKIFSGGKINHAVAPDGSRYADLDNAFLYRARVVDYCTCNGKDAFGLARMNIASDSTLRTGDIVAINGGFSAFTGEKAAARQAANFTPISQYSSLPSDWRRRLLATKVMPAPANGTVYVSPPVDPLAARMDNRRAQLSR
jgi:hypothetical protein